MSKPIAVVGSINMDLVVSADRLPAPGETIIGGSVHSYHGGKGANQAFAVARLGHPVLMVGALGDDGFGEALRGGLDAAGVDTRLIRNVEGPSGTALITTGSSGDNTIVVVPGANAKLTIAQLESCEAELGGAGMLLAQLEIPLECIDWLAGFAARHDIPLMLDPAPAAILPRSTLRNVRWLTPNETETGILTSGDGRSLDEAADELLAMGSANVLLKLGAKGCIIARNGHERIRIDAFAVDAVDTTAAGDAFNAGFAVGLLEGLDVRRAAHFATAVAGLSVTRRGAQPSMPLRDDVDRFLTSSTATLA
jgi:ribokinase